MVQEVNIPLCPARPTGDESSKVNREEFIKTFDDTHWPEDMKRATYDLLWNYRDIFALTHHQLGCFNKYKHHIELIDDTPIRQKYRRIPPHLFEAVKLELKKLMENGVITPSQSQWASPLSIAIKKDNSPRICLDYRKINALTKKDAKAIPNITEMIDLLHGKRWFSSIDLMQGFHQIELDEASTEITAFNAGPLGFFNYKRLPFGLTNASACFQRMMEYVLRDLLPAVCLVYIDDVIIHSETKEQHLTNMQNVFQCIRRYNLRLKPSKCLFFQRKLNFLGHTISSDGICADKKKVRAIQNWEPPKTIKQIRQFQGFYWVSA